MEKPQEKRQNGGATKFCGGPGNRLAAPLPKLAAPPPFSGSTCRSLRIHGLLGGQTLQANNLCKFLSGQNTKLHGYFDSCYVFRNSESKVRLMWHLENPDMIDQRGEIPNRTHGLSGSLAKTCLIKPRRSATPSGRECYTRTCVSTTSEEVGNTPTRPNPKTRSNFLLDLIF